MFYSEEMIKMMGYDSVKEFVEWFIKKYENCTVKFAPNGVYLTYDADTNVFEDIKTGLKQAIAYESSVNTTDWLTKGISDKKLDKEKRKALREFERKHRKHNE